MFTYLRCLKYVWVTQYCMTCDPTLSCWEQYVFMISQFWWVRGLDMTLLNSLLWGLTRLQQNSWIGLGSHLNTPLEKNPLPSLHRLPAGHTSFSLCIFSFIPHYSSTDIPYYQPHLITRSSSNSSCNVIALILCIWCFLYLEYQSFHSLSENVDSLFKISE